MNQDYYNAVTKMEEAGVDPEYIVGWEGGYVLNPPREEQRVTPISAHSSLLQRWRSHPASSSWRRL